MAGPDRGTASAAEPEPEWVWSVDPSGVFTYCSPACRMLIGYDPADLIGQPSSRVMDLTELGRGKAAVEEMGGRSGEWSGLIVQARHRDSTRLWFDVTGKPRHDADGKVTGFDGSSRLLPADDGEVKAKQQLRARVAAMLYSKLLMTAFQPIVDLSSGAVLGVEALTRFIAEPGATPDVWFTGAATVGLGTELELLAVETALAAAAQLPSHLWVSINASPRTCLSTGLADLIANSSVTPERIVLELTEHSPVDDYQSLGAALAGLRGAGVRVAIDDAGAGFASGRHIIRLQPDLIKVDGEIISGIDADPGRRALGASMVSFASEIGATVIAEGIETRAELETAGTLGCTAGQGYLIGRPSVKPQDWARWQRGAPLLPRPFATPIDSIRSGGPGDPRSTHAESLRDSADPPGIGGPDNSPGDFAPGHLAPGSFAPGNSAPGSFVPGNSAPANFAPGNFDFAAAVLDALPDATAVLDASGTIIAVNRAWRLFCLDCGGRPETSGPGVNYLQVCERAAADGNSDAVEVVEGLRAVLSGRRTESEREYPCDSPIATRWFISRMTAIGEPFGGAVASHVDITRRKMAEQVLAREASQDPLTGLANRVLFLKTLTDLLDERGNPSRGQVGVLYIDLDDFKPINDTYGHAAGDEMLLLTTHRLRGSVRAADTVARLGGDEFAVCVPETTAAALTELAATVRAILGRPSQIHGEQVRLTASVGAYLTAPGDSAAQALDCADRAMYAAKNVRIKRFSSTSDE